MVSMGSSSVLGAENLGHQKKPPAALASAAAAPTAALTLGDFDARIYYLEDYARGAR